MLETNNNKMKHRVLMIAVLMTGLFFFGVNLTKAQEVVDCNSLEKDSAKTDCWVKKAKSGQKDLKWAFLFEADLSGAILQRADLSKADLSKAKLRKADLIHANLYYAHLSGADLRGASLVLADLSGADLTNAILDADTNIKRASVDKTTKGIDFDDWKNRGGTVL